MKVIDVNTSEKLVTSACYDSIKSVPTCNRLYATRANNGKRLFRGYFLAPLFEGNLLTQRHEISSQKTRVFVAAHSEVFVILVCTILIGLQDEMDGRTNGRTDRRVDVTIAKTRRALHDVARKNSHSPSAAWYRCTC